MMDLLPTYATSRAYINAKDATAYEPSTFQETLMLWRMTPLAYSS